MIRIVIEIDIDDASRIGADRRRIAARAPDGYTVSDLRCMGWGRNLNTGAVNMNFTFKVTSPAGLLPRVDVFEAGFKK